MVDTVVLRFRPLTILLSVDWVIPHIRLSWLIFKLRCWHKSMIRIFTASPMVMGTPLFLMLRDYPIPIAKFNSFELK